jgi:hypothetical protein
VYALPLGAPYAFDGQAALCVDVTIRSRTNAGYVYLDRVAGADANPPTITRSRGTGCRYTASGPRLQQTSVAYAIWNNSTVALVIRADNAAPNATLVLTFGASDELLGGIPLPFVLPGTETSPSGACSVYNDVLVNVPVAANGAGVAQLNLNLGVGPDFNGLNLFTQFLDVDPAANNWSLVTSNGWQFHVVAPFATVPVGEVFHDASAGPTGTARANMGYVVRFD